MKRYEKYKDSGIEWLGEIPKVWSIRRLKDVFFQSSVTSNLIENESYVPLENIESATGKLLKRCSNESNETTTLFKEGDILLNKLRPYLNKVLLAEFNGGVSGEVVVLRPNRIVRSKINPKYFFYYLLSEKFNVKFNSLADGVKMPRTNPHKILSLSVLLPSQKEQQDIAKRLDLKTQLIDKKIELLNQKTETYKELRKTLINKVVCRGLNENVKFKDSGVDWIGKIPENWEVKRINEVIQERSEKVSDKKFPPLSVSMNGIVPQMEGTAKTKNNDDRKKVLKGDIVINSRSDRRGASGLSSYTGSVSVINIVLQLKNINGKYMHYLFKSNSFVEEYYKNGKGIVDDLWSTKYSVLKIFQICIPPLSQQVKIAEYLDKQTKCINDITNNIQQQIVNLQELRKTLINDVVTGKIKVTE